MKEIEEATVVYITPEEKTIKKKHIPREIPFTIVVNGKELSTSQCTPSSLRYLAVGFLLSEGVITQKEEIKQAILDEKDLYSRIYVEASIGMQTSKLQRQIASDSVPLYQTKDEEAIPRLDSQLQVSRDRIFRLMRQFQTKSSFYKQTHGNHSCALCNTDGVIMVFAEDISRHNVVDKVIGECLLKGISVEDKILATTSRISVDILNKIAKRQIPIIISLATVTHLALNLAKSLGLTVCGFAREQHMVIFTGDQRVI